jgi:hypothetical protein
MLNFIRAAGEFVRLGNNSESSQEEQQAHLQSASLMSRKQTPFLHFVFGNSTTYFQIFKFKFSTQSKRTLDVILSVSLRRTDLFMKFGAIEFFWR